MAQRWAALGAPRIHVVDLDGARAGKLVNRDVILAMAGEVSATIEVGGGLRSLEAMEELISAGVGWVVLGTAAIEDKALVEAACRRWGDRVVVGVDARDGK